MNIESNVSQIFNPNTKNKILIPLFLVGVSAGFPSPAEDYIEKHLDLNELLIHHKHATYFCKISGDSMVEASINDGDIVIVDSNYVARNGDIVIVAIDGEFLIRFFSQKGNQIILTPAHPEYEPIIVDCERVKVWGIVTNAIHTFRHKKQICINPK